MNRREVSRRGLGLAALTMAVALTAGGSCYFSSATTVCERSGLICRSGQVCAADQQACIEPSGCGDGVVSDDKGEVCDDGNIVDGDGCSKDCTSAETCGNGVVDEVLGETCDRGDTVDGDGCSSKCDIEACGNRTLDKGEFCDDGNSVSGDGCNSKCSSNEACGNGRVDVDESGGPLQEECDPTPLFPSPAVNTDACDSDCTFPQCGDGHFNAAYLIPETFRPEECDTGADSKSCDNDCTFVDCGDRHINAAAGEECDNGTDNSNRTPNACRRDCTRPACGDGVRDPVNGEQCDDGDDDNSDDCLRNCEVSSCGDGFVRRNGSGPDEACDHAATPSGCPDDKQCDDVCKCIPRPNEPPPLDVTAR